MKLAVESASAAGDHAIKCGKLLLKAKNDAGHGNWGVFFGDQIDSRNGGENYQFEFNQQQANRYMRTAKNPKLTRYLVKQDEAQEGP